MVRLAAIVLVFALLSCASDRIDGRMASVFPCDCPSDQAEDYSLCGKKSYFCRAGGTELNCIRPGVPSPLALCR